MERVLWRGVWGAGGEPPRLFKSDTVSEKFNKAENNPGCQICLPKVKSPECLLSPKWRRKQYFQAKKKRKKKSNFLEKRNSVSALVWVLEAEMTEYAWHGNKPSFNANQ